MRLVRQLLDIEARGAQVIAFSADVGDRDAMTRVIGDCCAQLGTLNGVFHAAGTLDDAPIAAKDGAGIQRVLRPKACGAQVLHELLPPGDLDLFAVFSSTSVYLGVAGQVDYAAANAFLDALAASRSDGLTIHWGLWGDKGMAARAYGHADPGDGAGAHPLLWGLRWHRPTASPSKPATRPHRCGCCGSTASRDAPSCPARPTSSWRAPPWRCCIPHRRPRSARSRSRRRWCSTATPARRVRTELRRTGDTYEFIVRSRGSLDDRWLDHARARVGVFEGSLPSAPPAPAGEWQSGEIPQRDAVAFGARWQNITRMRLAGRSAIAQFALAREFEGDLARFGCHPALTDMAATFGLNLLDAGERRKNLFVPLSIERVRLARRVPRELLSRVTLKGDVHNRVAAFDVALHSLDGQPIATFEGFSLRGVQPDAVTHEDRPAARREPGLVDAMLACGITAADAPALFERIFSGPGRDVTVSSIAIDELKRAIAAATPRPARRAPGAQRSTGAQDLELNAVERTLAQAWRELLGVDEVRRDDDFFALGGHSLAAVRLFAKIRKRFSVDLPLATLFQAPTLGALAAVVAHAGGLDSAPASEEPRKAPSNVISLGTRAWSPLVAICKGRPERKPLFCVHGAGGNVLNFRIFSDRLGPELPFYGLQAQGADGRLTPLPTIEAMASQYVESVRTVDPVGPYRLAGYSAGGVIALEMAHQLIESGAAVSLLVMIDTLAPAAAARKVSYLQKLWLARHWSLRFLLDWPDRRRRFRLMELNYAVALEKLARGESLTPELVQHHLFRSFVTAQALHKPRSYPGSMVLFKATESEMQYLQAGRSLGWDAQRSAAASA